MQNSPIPLLTISEVAKIVDASTRTVYRLIEDGEITPTMVSKTLKVSVDDLRDYLKNARQPSKEQQAVNHLYNLNSKKRKTAS